MDLGLRKMKKVRRVRVGSCGGGQRRAGATAEGKKELIGLQTGMRESGQSWKELLVDLKARGLVVAPQVAIGDGARSGFGRPSTRRSLPPVTNDAGCTRH